MGNSNQNYKKLNNLYVDLHVIQTVPPSCVNRDDTGSPKTAIYGGAVRARVSSQSWKRAIRLQFQEKIPEKTGLRTKKIVELIAKRIKEKTQREDADKLAKNVLDAIGIKTKDNKEESAEAKALFFISQGQIEALADLAINSTQLDLKDKNEKKEYKEKADKAIKSSPDIDIALFGRMVADDPSLNFDAACQVAHAISTHAVQNEYDYFTAIDDCSPEDNAGAGHLGTIEYNSSTLYRYATINVRELYKNLEEDTVLAVKEFVDAFVTSMPTGKINTFANRTLPDAVYVTIRDDQPVNLVGAFEKPIKTRQEGFVQGSIEALISKAKQTYSDFLGEPKRALGVGEALQEIAEHSSFAELLEKLEDELTQYVKENEDEVNL